MSISTPLAGTSTKPDATDVAGEADPNGAPAPAPGAPVIEIRGLARHYRMGQYEVQALKRIDLTIQTGEFVAIVGPSGSGKSTLMYLIGCLDTPTAGSYRLCGREVSHLDDTQLSGLRNRAIGFVFQQFCLLPDLNVTENVALGLAYAGQDRAGRQRIARGLAARMGLEDRLHHKPAELSGGQMQRTAIARALASQPHILLADEPTGNLDSQTSGQIMDLIRQLHATGKTIIMVTHDPKVADEAHRVIRLVDGQVVSDERRGGDAQALDAPQGADPPADEPFRGLRLSDLGRIALREGLLAHKLRSILTMLGIIFGIAAVIAMTAITEGGKRQQLDQLRQIGMNNIQVSDLDLEAARLLRQRRINPRGVTLDDLAHLRQYVEGVEAAAAWKAIAAEVRHGDVVVEDADTIGVDGAFESVVNYHVERGRFIDALDAARFRRVCALGPQLADELALGDEPIGKVVLIGDQPFTVVGVMERKAFMESDIADIHIVNRNRDLYVPHEVLRLYFRKDSKDSELDVISLRMTGDEHLVDQADLIRHVVASLHHGAADFAVSVPLEKLKQAQQTKQVFNVIIVVIAGISLVVGGIGIMNIMLATVTERTNEIGIRRAIGASRRDVLSQFLTESLFIAFFGGVLGIITGILGGFLLQEMIGFPVAFNLLIMPIAALVSMAIGVAFGLYPAWTAAHMDPVEALRN